MKSFIAVLTYRRIGALRTTLAGIKQHCPQYPLAVFEDMGNRDGTSAFLSKGPHQRNEELMAEEYDHPDGYKAFLGTVNLGVSGNSNRAIRAFEKSDCDHLCLLNDDLHVLGDFVAYYAKAHTDLGVGFWCMNDFWESETHRWIIARSRGYRVKIFPRYTGIMLSFQRDLVNKIGYFDMRFPKMGEEHSDYTNRARFAGAISLDGQPQPCLDVEPTLPNGKAGPPLLQHQDVEPSVSGPERKLMDQESVIAMQAASMRYHYEHYYQPFRLSYPSMVSGINQQGIPTELVPNYKIASSCA